MMTTVKLYGKLGKLFGRTWRLNVNSPREAVCAIDANRPGLSAYLTRNSLPGYHVIVGDRDRDETELDLKTEGRTIKIIPYVKGRSTGWGKVIAGVVLVVVGVWWRTPASPYLINAGLSLIFGGISQLLTKPPTLDQPNERDKSRPSYSFDGPVNTTAQGWPMSVGYGTLCIGGALVSMSVATEDFFPGTDGPDPETGAFQILGYSQYNAFRESYENPVAVITLGTTGGTTPITYSITDQPLGDFFTIAPVDGYPAYCQITWLATVPLADHVLTIHAEDDDALTADKTLTISIIG